MFADTVDLSVHCREGVCVNELKDYAARRAALGQIVDTSHRLLSKALLEALVLMDDEATDEFFAYLFRELPAEFDEEPEQQQLAEYYLQAFRGMLNDRADRESVRTHRLAS